MPLHVVLMLLCVKPLRLGLVLCAILGLAAGWVWLSWWPALAVTGAAVGGVTLIVWQTARDARPKRPLLTMFQFNILREAAFENDEGLVRVLRGEVPAQELGNLLLNVAVMSEFAGSNPPGYGFALYAACIEEMEKFAPVAVHPRHRDGLTAYVITMPEARFPVEAHFIAIVHRDGEPHEFDEHSPSTRYFMLEKSFVGGNELCEWRRDGSRVIHTTYGKGPLPDLESFAAAVFAQIAAEPGGHAK